MWISRERSRSTKDTTGRRIVSITRMKKRFHGPIFTKTPRAATSAILETLGGKVSGCLTRITSNPFTVIGEHFCSNGFRRFFKFLKRDTSRAPFAHFYARREIGETCSSVTIGPRRDCGESSNGYISGASHIGYATRHGGKVHPSQTGPCVFE
jgi:hypothetical protein